MLISIAMILLMGMFMGWICKKIHLPQLLGMIITGIVLGPNVLDLLDDTLLSISSDLRRIALVIILTRAGLSLNINDLKKVGEELFEDYEDNKYKKDIKDDKDLYILTDVNKSYMVSIPECLGNPDNVIIIDHHNEDDKTVLSNEKCIDPSMSSASEIVLHLLSLFKCKSV